VKRWLMHVLVGISLLMCMLTSALWMRSYRRSDTIRWVGRTFEIREPSKLRVVMIYSGQGCIEVAMARDPYWSARDSAITHPWMYVVEDKPKHPAMTQIRSGSTLFLVEDEPALPAMSQVQAGSKRTWGGFGMISGGTEGPAAGPGFALLSWTESFKAVWMPHWFLTLLFGALPAQKAYRWMELGLKLRWRKKSGLCGACGYDLRGSAGQCPECGQAISEVLA
jgi:hypothetical protein